MATNRAKQTSREKAREKSRAYRARMKAKGYRLVQRWYPDSRTEEFKKMAHEASLAIARSEHEAEDQAFIDAITVNLDEFE